MKRVVDDQRARQGPKGKPVLVVLVSSLILIGAALAIYMMWVDNESPPGTAGISSNPAETTQAPMNSPANPANPAPAVPNANAPVRQP